MRNLQLVTLFFLSFFQQNVWATSPSVPNGMRFEAYSQTTIELFWNRSTDDVGVASYEVVRNGTVINTLDGLSLIDRELTSDIQYIYEVTAIDNEGNRSAAASITVSSRPSTPTGLRAVVYSSTAAELFWDRPNTTLPVRYEIRRDGAVQAMREGVTYFDDSLSGDSLYQYTVSAIGPSDVLSDSVSISVSTQAGNALDYFAPPPQTAQIISFASGDDGAWQKGVPLPVPRFTAHDDGTFKDNLTGLIWLSVNHCISFGEWSAAVATANALEDDGVTCDGLSDDSKAGDWRLPNVRELQSLIDYSADFPAFGEFPPYTGTGFTVYPFNEYWTSTTLAVDANVAWIVTLELGHVSTRLKQEELRIWPVRGGQ